MEGYFPVRGPRLVSLPTRLSGLVRLIGNGVVPMDQSSESSEFEPLRFPGEVLVLPGLPLLGPLACCVASRDIIPMLGSMTRL